MQRDSRSRLTQRVDRFTFGNRPLPPAAQWLDLLPPDVNLRIAQELFQHGTRHRDMCYASSLQLAKTSFLQKQNVMKVLNHTVVLEGEDDLGVTLAGLFHDDVRGVVCHKWKGPGEVIMMALASRCLEWAKLNYRKEVLEQMGEVRRLCIVFEEEVECVQFVKMESVQELKIVGRMKERIQEHVVKCFPNLIRLELVVFPLQEDVSGLECLSKLKTLRTTSELYDRNLSFLRRLDEVQVVTVSRCGDLPYVSDQVLESNVISGIEINAGRRLCYQGFWNFEGLAFCLRLKHLEIPIMAGDEILLPSLPSLQCLIFKRVRKRATHVHRVETVFLTNLVRSSPKLAHIEICYATTSPSDVQMLLQNLPLHTLGITVLPNSIHEVRLMGEIMQLVRKHRPQLSALHLYEMVMHKQDMASEQELQQWRFDLNKMVEVLRRTTSLTNTRDLSDKLQMWCSMSGSHLSTFRFSVSQILDLL